MTVTVTLVLNVQHCVQCCLEDMKHNVIILPFTLNRLKQNSEVEKASPSATMSSGKSALTGLPFYY